MGWGIKEKKKKFKKRSFSVRKMWLAVVYRFALETNVPAVNHQDLWTEDLSAKLLLGLWDDWKSSEADTQSAHEAHRIRVS